MPNRFYFNKTRLRYIKAAMISIPSYRPDGKLPADVEAMIAGLDLKQGDFTTADQVWGLARGEFHEASAAGHKLCVKIYPIMKSRYRDDPGSSEAIARLPTEDDSPDDTKKRMKDMSALWINLPNPPDAVGPFEPWPLMTQVVFETARVLVDTREADMTPKKELYELAQGHLNKVIDAADVFGTQATIQGRGQFDPGTPERDVIDQIPNEPATQEPGQGVISSATSPGAGQLTAVYDAPHATSWDVLLKGPGQPDFVVVVNDTIEKTATIGGLAAGAYEVEVRGHNSRGDGPLSAPSAVAVA